MNFPIVIKSCDTNPGKALASDVAASLLSINSIREMLALVSHPILRMTHPYRKFFVLSLFCVLCVYVRLRVQGLESSINKENQMD
jgi:hypothetical protein